MSWRWVQRETKKEFSQRVREGVFSFQTLPLSSDVWFLHCLLEKTLCHNCLGLFHSELNFIHGCLPSERWEMMNWCLKDLRTLPDPIFLLQVNYTPPPPPPRLTAKNKKTTDCQPDDFISSGWLQVIFPFQYWTGRDCESFARRTFTTPKIRTFTTPKFGHFPPPQKNICQEDNCHPQFFSFFGALFLAFSTYSSWRTSRMGRRRCLMRWSWST